MLEPREVRSWETLTATMLRHAADQDPEALAQVVAILQGAMDQLPDVADKLRAQGYSWANLGQALGVSRSAAQQRFGKK